MENSLDFKVMNNGDHQPQNREGESDDGDPVQGLHVLVVLSERLQQKHKQSLNPFPTAVVASAVRRAMVTQRAAKLVVWLHKHLSNLSGVAALEQPSVVQSFSS